MRQVNRSSVERLLRERAGLSRAELARLTGLAKPTVSSIVAELLADGVVRESGPAASGMGRRPILLEFVSAREYVVGVQVGVNRTVVMVADSSGGAIANLEAAPVPHGGSDLTCVAQAVRDCLRSARVPRRRAVAVGVSVPGTIESETGDCVLAPNLGWHDVPVRRQLEMQLGLPVFVVNVAQAAAVAEAEEGAAVGAGNIVLLYAGTGVGAGVLVDGAIYRGGGGMTGEIGHCAIPGEDASCRCGHRGCLEAVAGADAIAAAYSLTGRGSHPQGGGARAVSEAAGSGEPAARAILSRAGHALGYGASWLVNLFNPEVLVLAGSLVSDYEFVVTPLLESLAEHSLDGAARQVRVVHTALGRDAYVRGAVLIARQKTMSHYRAVSAG